YVPAAEAKPGPPLAPILGQHQVNLIEFCKEFNKLSLNYINGVPLMVKVLKRESNKFSLNIRPPSNKFFLDQILSEGQKKEVSIEELYDIIILKSELIKNSKKRVARMFFGFLKSKKVFISL